MSPHKKKDIGSEHSDRRISNVSAFKKAGRDSTPKDLLALQIEQSHRPPFTAEEERKKTALIHNTAVQVRKARPDKKRQKIIEKAKAEGKEIPEPRNSVLNAEQRQYLKTHYPETEDAINLMVEYNYGLCVAMAVRFRQKNKAVELVDLCQAGALKLRSLIECFNPDKGFKFSTYACGSLLRHYSLEAQRAAKRQGLSLDSMGHVAGGDDMSASHNPLMEDTYQPPVDEDVLRNEDVELLYTAMAQLSEKEQTVLARRFGLNGNGKGQEATLHKVGCDVGLTKERVRQIQNQALRKLHKCIAEAHKTGQEKNGCEYGP